MIEGFLKMLSATGPTVGVVAGAGLTVGSAVTLFVPSHKVKELSQAIQNTKDALAKTTADREVQLNELHVMKQQLEKN